MLAPMSSSVGLCPRSTWVCASSFKRCAVSSGSQTCFLMMECEMTSLPEFTAIAQVTLPTRPRASLLCRGSPPQSSRGFPIGAKMLCPLWPPQPPAALTRSSAFVRAIIMGIRVRGNAPTRRPWDLLPVRVCGYLVPFAGAVCWCTCAASKARAPSSASSMVSSSPSSSPKSSPSSIS
jgi:hypothetical protein